MRGYRGEDWCLSVVINKSWVRCYIRRPELGRGVLDSDELNKRFPDATLTGKSEIAVNIRDAGTAVAFLEFLEEAL